MQQFALFKQDVNTCLHTCTHIHTRAKVHWSREGEARRGGGVLAAWQGQETLGLKPITNTRISSHVHTAF